MASVNELSRSASRKTLVRLVVFSLALGLGPLTAYYVSLTRIWPENATYAAITAIMTANAVLVSYIITSVLEDQKEAKPATPAEDKKNL